MKDKHQGSADSAKLRQKAEEQLDSNPSSTTILHTEADMLKLIHELKVHRIELEMQNEELELAKIAAQDAVNLYDLAPTGYFTLSAEGDILNINLCGSQMLGKDRRNLMHSRFALFLSDETRLIYNNFLNKVFSSNTQQVCEVTLSSCDALPMHLQLTGQTCENGLKCLLVGVNITEHRKAEDILRMSEVRYRTLFENSLAGILITNHDGTIMGANPEACRLLGRSEADICSMGRNGVVNLADPNLPYVLEERSRKGFYCGELTFARGDGTIFPVYLASNIVKDASGKLNTNIFFQDITVRKQIEYELIASEDRYRKLIEHSTEAILIYVEGVITLVNRVCLRLMAASNEEELVGKSVIQFVHPDYLDQVNERMAELANDGTTLSVLSERFIRFDGVEIDIEINAMSMMLGDKVAVQLIFRDITERKRAELALLKSEEKYRFMFANNPQPMWIFDVETCGFLEVNEAAVILYGYSSEEFLSMTIKDIRPPEDMPELMIHLEPSRHKHNAIGEFRHIKKSGEIIDVEITWHSVIVNGREARHVLVNDITEIKRSKALELEAINRLLKIASLLPGVIYQYQLWPDDSSCFPFASQAMYDMFGVRPEELTEDASTLLKLIHPDDNSGAADSLHFSAKELSPWQHEFRLILSDGSIHTLFGNGIPQQEEDGSVTWYGFMADITEHKRAEMAFQEMNNRLLKIASQLPGVMFQFRLLPDGSSFFPYLSEGMYDMFGIRPEELSKDASALSKLHHPDDDLGVLASLQVSAKELSPWQHEFRLILSDGSIHTLFGNGVPQTEEDGSVTWYGFMADITEHKRAEMALHEMEANLNAVLNATDESIFVFSNDNILLALNKVAAHNMGRTRSELIGCNIIDLLPPDIFARRQPYFKQLRSTRKPVQFEDERNGQWMKNWLYPILGTDNEVIRMAIFSRNITESKLADEALRVSERQYRDMFYKNTAIKLIVDPSDGQILNANNAAARYYGYSINRLEKMNINQINTLPEELVLSEMSLALSERRLYFDFQHRLASGEVREVEVYSGPIEFDGGTKLYSIVHDVTDRNLAQATLRNLNWRLESILESTRVGTWQWNVQTGDLIVNERWAQIIGYTLDELAPVSIKTWERLCHPEDLIYSNELLRQHFASELSFYDFDSRMKHKNGKWIWIHDRGSVATHTDDGRPLMMFGTHSDISARKQVEETLRMKEENLQKINAEKDKFFSIIAHDLRSPFNGFLGLNEIMAEKLSEMTLAEIQEIAELLRKSAINLFGLLGNLLEWSRMQRGLTSFDPKPILLLKKITDDLVIVRDAADKKNMNIHYEIPKGLKVFADENMLGGILRNLVTNAVKFTPKGGDITVSAVKISADLAEISVRDTGIGMTNAMIDNLFHLDVNTNRKGTEGEYSTGLGLMICKDFIEKIGGKLSIESEDGKGSNFKFTVPIKNNDLKS